MFADQFGRAIRGSDDVIDIDAAFEAVTRLSRKAEFARGLSNAFAFEISDLEQNGGCRIGDTRIESAHNTADRDGFVGIADCEDRSVEFSFDLVERFDGLARFCTSDDDPPS